MSKSATCRPISPLMVKDASRKSESDLTAEVLQNMRFLELDGLVVIGGDATQSVGAVLAAQGVPVWGIPETMDNDVPGTEYCLGFQTAIDRAAEYIGRIRSTAGSHRETILFRMFGRNAGFTALETAVVASVDRVLIPEVPADVDRLAELVAADRHNPHNYSTVVLSEGANLGMPVPEEGPADAHGHRKKANIAEFLAKELGERLPGVRFLPIDLTYILRAGEPVARDRHMAIFYANLIMSHVEAKRSGVMAAYRDGQFIVTDIPGKNHPPRRVNRAGYHSHAVSLVLRIHQRTLPAAARGRTDANVGFMFGASKRCFGHGSNRLHHPVSRGAPAIGGGYRRSQ